SELRPLVEAPLERHRAIEMDDDRGRGEIEEHDGGEPEENVGRPLLCRHPDPWKADDEQDLCEDEIGQAELLAKLGAVRFDYAASRTGSDVGGCHSAAGGW